MVEEELNSNKIKACPKVISENKRMESVSVNKNPRGWNNQSTKGLRISSLNVRSLRKHIEDVKSDIQLLQSDMICLQETWLDEAESNGNQYEVDGYDCYYNSQGRGKGTAVYIKKGQFKHSKDVKKPNLQMSKFTSTNLDVIVIYRSQEESLSSVKSQLKSLIQMNKSTLVVGDFNFCYKTNNNDVSKYFIEKKFNQLVNEATHIDGSLLDHAYFRSVRGLDRIDVELFATYYSDHDTIAVLILDE